MLTAAAKGEIKRIPCNITIDSQALPSDAPIALATKSGMQKIASQAVFHVRHSMPPMANEKATCLYWFISCICVPISPTRVSTIIMTHRISGQYPKQQTGK